MGLGDDFLNEAVKNVTFDFEPCIAILEQRAKKWQRPVSERKQVVCQYWLRRLIYGYSAGCSKGELCDFLHVDIPEKRPLCTHYLQKLKDPQARGCNKKNCIFRHENKQPCHAYERGYCKYGPKCVRTHTKHDHMCRNGPHCRIHGCKEPHPRPITQWGIEPQRKRQRR